MLIENYIKRLTNTAPPVDLDHLKAFELIIGASLPDDYRKFLLATNGGIGHFSTPFSRMNRPGRGKYRVRSWAGLRLEPKYLSLWFLRGAFQSLELRIPLQLLPIGFDPGDGVFCIGLTDEYRGKMYYFYSEEEGIPASIGDDLSIDELENLTLIAPSFAEMISYLKVERQ
jgi:hypothetical protein